MQYIQNKKEFFGFVTNNDKFYLYGAGSVGSLVFNIIEYIGYKDNVIAVIDSNACLFGGVLVCSPSDIDYQQINEIPILVTTTQKFHHEIDKIFDKNTAVYFLSDIVIAQLRVILRNMDTNALTNQLYKLHMKSIPLTQIQFSVHLCEHCNLNCAGCDNFSPLASEEYADLNIYKKDIERLSTLSGGDAYRILLMGGEPFLNPSAIEYAKIARIFFPKARIAFVSNGLLVKKLEEDFFDVCRRYRIGIDLTPYPIDLDYRDLQEYIKSKGVVSGLQKDSMENNWRKEPLSLDGRQLESPAITNWINCYASNNCIALRNGRLSCTKLTASHHFINYFKDECKEMYYSERDFIDIYKANSIKEILDFFAKPLPFCKYCNPDKTEHIGWKQSNKTIQEWT